MKCCAFSRSGDLVMDSDLDGITPICLDQWSRELSVDQKNVFLIAIGGLLSSGDSKIISSNDTSIWCIFVRIRIVCISWTPRETLWERLFYVSILIDNNMIGRG